jgi:small subunit ribosomal protein S5
VLEFAGVKNVLSKVYGSTAPKNVVKATLNGLLKLRNKENIEALRGVEVAAMKR